mgnify:CR=1 FL=1|tara:strand:- start:186 stop:389 length:204 start_codon:yes stop_codon:yes gene_type:complete
MAKSTNSGLFRQDQIIAQFNRDLKQTEDNSAVAQALKAGRRAEAERKKRAAKKAAEPRMVYPWQIKA